MTKLAVIAPEHDLQWGIAGDIEFWQAEWVVEHMTEMPARMMERFTIVDNQHVSADLESQSNADWGVLMRAANALDADEIVLPDILRDASATIASARIHSQYTNQRKMFVPQGKNVMDVLECMRTAIDDFGERFHTIGLTKIVASFGHDARWAMVPFIPPQYDIHFLGVLKGVSELKSHPRVRSWDTSLPIAAAQHGRLVTGDDKFELIPGAKVDPALALRNIEVLKQRLAWEY